MVWVLEVIIICSAKKSVKFYTGGEDIDVLGRTSFGMANYMAYGSIIIYFTFNNDSNRFRFLFAFSKNITCETI